MSKKTFFSTSGIIFFVIMMIHLLRIVLELGVIIGETVIPMWWSWIAVIIAGSLAYHGLKFNHKSK